MEDGVASCFVIFETDVGVVRKVREYLVVELNHIGIRINARFVRRIRSAV